MLAAEEIALMSPAEKVDAMERLWASLSKDAVDVPSPRWHGEVLGERAKLVGSEKAVWLSVNELQIRLETR